MRSSTRSKLHPDLQIMLDALRRGRNGLPSEQAAIGASLLHGILCMVEDICGGPGPRDHGPVPVMAKSSDEEAALALMSKIKSVAPFVQKGEHMDLLEALPDLMVRPKTESQESLWHSLKSALGMAKASHESLEPVEKIFCDPMRDAACSIRSNRNPQAAFRKLSHHMILTFLFLFGALRGTSSDLSEGALTLGEVTEVFNWYCPSCGSRHSPDALRMGMKRFLRETLKKWPANKIKRTRSRSASTEIRHTGLPKLQPHRPS